jgi:hypothetical protein
MTDGSYNATVNPVADNYFSTLRTRSIVEPEFLYDKFPKFENVPKNLNIDYTKILNKPYFVKNVVWKVGDAQYAKINLLNIPTDILVNELTQYPFHTSVMYRARISLIYQVAATPMHQGSLIVAACPTGFNDVNYTSNNIVNPMMSAPHAFLYANESTAVRLQVPFYVNGKMAMTAFKSNTIMPSPFDSGNYSEVVIAVLNQLECPTSAVTEVTVSVHAVFDELDFYVPHIDVAWEPQGIMDYLGKPITKGADGLVSLGKKTFGDIFDGLRAAFRHYTGLHAPNVPITQDKTIVTTRQNLNSVDSKTSYEKLDPYYDYSRITKDFIFDTEVDEMLLGHILTKPQFLGTFKVKSDDTTGTLLWSRPITPIIPNYSGTAYTNDISQRVNSSNISNLISVFGLLSKYWKGSINIHIQSNMTNFHFCKVQLARNYSPVGEQFGNKPIFSSIQNLMVDTMEFSGGGQVQTVKLPFVSTLEMLPITTDWIYNACQHGMYYIYLAQPLVSNGAVAKDVSFNVYFSVGDDFQYYGYATNPLMVHTPQNDPSFEAEAATMQPISDQASLTNPGIDTEPQNSEMMRPIVSVRDYLRRLTKVETFRYRREELATFKGVVSIDVANLLGRRSFQTPSKSINVAYASPLDIIGQMFLGSNGGLKLKLVVTGSSVVSAWYIPPSFNIDNQATQLNWASTFPLPASANQVNYDFFTHQFTPVNYGNYGIKFNNPAPSIERPNWVNSAGTESVNVDDGASQVFATTVVLECHVPNMSPFRFVGDGYQLYGHDANDQIYTATSDMGHIVLSTSVPWQTSPNIANQASDVHIAAYAGFDDEARLGYQVNVPNVLLSAFLQGTKSYQTVPYCTPSDVNASAFPPLSYHYDTTAANCYRP